jgi:hypothetical protein
MVNFDKNGKIKILKSFKKFIQISRRANPFGGRVLPASGHLGDRHYRDWAIERRTLPGLGQLGVGIVRGGRLKGEYCRAPVI